MFSTRQNARMARIGMLAMLLAGLGGCAEHLGRMDAISNDAGDAVARNRIAHIIDPWPYHAGNTRVHTDAERMRHVNERYRNPPKSNPAATNDNTIKLNLSGGGGDDDE